VEFNFARVWHGLNLSHLAVEGYERVLQIGEEIQQQSLKQSKGSTDDPGVDMDGSSSVAVTSDQNFVEDFSREAAFALQCLHVFGGDAGTAKNVTEKWLVI
jgi:general transcription factor 3C polypeptide 3 (transcription factor C subunit 4)